MKKQLASMMAAVVILTPAAAFAEGNGASLNDAGRDKAQERLLKQESDTKDAQLAASSNGIEYDPDGEFYSVSVTNYMQETGYWCGPASVRQSLSYHKTKSGSATALPSQTTLASKAGTTTDGSTTTGLRNALNAYQSTYGFSANPYVVADVTNTTNPLSTFETRVKGVLRNNTNAPIVLVETQYIPRYAGKALRHYVTVSSYAYEYATGAKDLKTVDPNYMTAYYGAYWDPMGSTTANGVFRAVYNADLHGSNYAMTY